jgi:ribosomal protein S10
MKPIKTKKPMKPEASLTFDNLKLEDGTKAKTPRTRDNTELRSPERILDIKKVKKSTLNSFMFLDLKKSGVLDIIVILKKIKIIIMEYKYPGNPDNVSEEPPTLYTSAKK